MTRAVRAVWTTGLLTAALATAPARADETTAKRLTKQATLAYKLGHFQEALEDFSMAYGEYAAPLLLFNIGQCHRELGNYERAAFFLRGYLREVPHAKNRALVEDLISESESKLAAQQAEMRRRQEEEKEKRELKIAETTLMAEQTQLAVQAPIVDRTQLEKDERAGKTKVAVGLGVAAAGVVAVGVGVYFGVRSNSDSNTVSQAVAEGRPWTPSIENTYRDGSRSVVVADVLFAVGAGVAIAGGVVAVLGWRQSAAARKALSVAGLSPEAGAGRAPLAWSF